MTVYDVRNTAGTVRLATDEGVFTAYCRPGHVSHGELYRPAPGGGAVLAAHCPDPKFSLRARLLAAVAGTDFAWVRPALLYLWRPFLGQEGLLSAEDAAAPTEPPRIDSFEGEYAFLSNFYPSVLRIDGIDYPTAEHYYQAQKSRSLYERAEVAACRTPGQAKRAGADVDLRPDWEQVKEGVMARALQAKFPHDENHPLTTALVNTGAADLVEGNTWGDRYWGVDRNTGEGENRLGALLMERRRNIVNLRYGIYS